MEDLTVVAHVDKALQTMGQRVLIGIEHTIIDNQRIELVAWLEAAHLAKERTCRLSGYPEDFRKGEERLRVILLVVHLTYLDGVGEHTEHIQVVTATDIAAQTDLHAFIKQ